MQGPEEVVVRLHTTVGYVDTLKYTVPYEDRNNSTVGYYITHVALIYCTSEDLSQIDLSYDGMGRASTSAADICGSVNIFGQC